MTFRGGDDGVALLCSCVIDGAALWLTRTPWFVKRLCFPECSVIAGTFQQFNTHILIF